MSSRLDQELQDLLGDPLADLPPEARKLAADLMSRVRELKPRSLSEVMDQVLQSVHSVGHTGSRGAVNPGSSINIIPPPPGTPGFCAPLVLTIATRPPGGTGSRVAYSPHLRMGMALRLLREHLVHCGTGPKGIWGRTSIFITDHWVRQSAYESRRDIEEHAKTGGLSHVFLLWEGQRWSRKFL